jgi:hypothetical protein
MNLPVDIPLRSCRLHRKDTETERINSETDPEKENNLSGSEKIVLACVDMKTLAGKHPDLFDQLLFAGFVMNTALRFLIGE